jgi:hypothetical protein
MASIGKFTAALTSVSNEVTVAAANFNIDFTLMKIEAPQEYQGLGTALSTGRREQAESGTAHTTARKLGALFEHIIPHTPKLYGAYGQRASEIAKSQSANSASTQIGPFSAHVGLDGTSIWAAATSGKRAIAIHLLACMLGKIWKGPEAISVWVELVARRKSQILSELDQSSFQATASFMAAQQEITRTHLAAWDASARAWLQTADEANLVRQTQLRLVLDNINMPVNNQADLYQSVLKAWTNALVMVESLVAGMPQCVKDGAVLLGLSAWHLYPDMLVLGQDTAHIKQKDDLIGPGGILTIGLHRGDCDKESGIFWSLPLAHMRYYGSAPTVSRSLTADSSRVSLEQLYQVALGCLSAVWGTDIPGVVNILIALGSALLEPNDQQYLSLTPQHWFWTLFEAAVVSQKSRGQNKEVFAKLNGLGARRAMTFLSSNSWKSERNFGLFKFRTLLPLLKGAEARIKLLRHISTSLDVDPNDIFIRYRSDCSEGISFVTYASALPHSFQTLKRSRDGVQQVVESHIRWTYCPKERGCDRPYSLDSDPFKHQIEALLLTEEKCYFLDPASIRESDQFTLAWREFGKERNIVDESEILQHATTEELVYLHAYDGDEDEVEFDYLMGDWNSAALFIRKGLKLDRYEAYGHGSDITNEELVAALSMKLIDPKTLDHYLDTWGVTGLRMSEFTPAESSLSISLRNLAAAKALYDELRYATVNLSVISQPLHQAKWAHVSSYGDIISLDLPQIFSCIAMFESGSFNINPEHLHRVMALSVGNSIYIADLLIREPLGPDLTRKVTRITGNLGRAEMAMLVSPTMPPPLKSLDYDNWNLINHVDFDGTCQGCFQNTTLHLSFTDFEMPIDVGTRGIRDTEAILIESVVSVHDRGQWVGDLDIMSALASSYLRWVRHGACSHSEDEQSFSQLSPTGEPNRLISIDSWDELLDIPPQSIIVRAHNNWLARLAAAAISIQKERVAVFLPRNVCWECLRIEMPDSYGCGVISLIF